MDEHEVLIRARAVKPWRAKVAELEVEVARLRRIETAARVWRDSPTDDSDSEDALIDVLDEEGV